MNIIQIIPSLNKGGAERLVIDICSHLSQISGVRVKLVLLRDEIQYDLDRKEFDIDVVNVNLKCSLWKKNRVNVSDLQKIFNDFLPDIIHTHLFESELISRFCYCPHAKWFSHCHDNMIQFDYAKLNNFLSKKTIVNRYEKNILLKNYKRNGGTTFIAISEHSQKYFLKNQKIFDVILLKNAINIKNFYPPNDAKTKENSGGKEINIINVGSFVSKKNQIFLIDIACELEKLGINARIHFLGDGPLKNVIRDKCIESKLNSKFIFHGNVEDVQTYLWNADIYVHTAKYEPFGLVLLEAMAAKTPIISLNGLGNKDIIIDNINGYLLQEENPEYFAKKIIEVYQNKSNRERIIQNASDFVEEYDISKYCQKLIRLYKSQLDQNILSE